MLLLRTTGPRLLACNSRCVAPVVRLYTPSLSKFPSHTLSSMKWARPLSTRSTPPSAPQVEQKPVAAPLKLDKHENIYTIPNALTLARILATPVIGYYVLQGEIAKATALLFVAGVSDLVDGWLARKYGMGSVLGSILDPAADKFLMTTMVVTLAMKGLLPLPLAVLIIGRDVALTISAFYFRYASLPPPKTFTRYWDFSIPSAEVKPTQLSKYNTALQLLLVGLTTLNPLLPYDLSGPLFYLQWVVAATTVGSGATYLFGGGVKYVK